MEKFIYTIFNIINVILLNSIKCNNKFLTQEFNFLFPLTLEKRSRELSVISS